LKKFSMKKTFTSILFLSCSLLGFSQNSWEDSFTGQSNFGNPTGWDNLDGFTVWNVYPNHGRPQYGLTRSFVVNQSDSIGTPSASPINVALNSEFKVDARVMAFSLYPSSIATLPATASVSFKAFDGVTSSTIATLTAANQNTDTAWVTLTGSLSAFAGGQIQILVVGKNGAAAPAEDYFVDLDNFRVTDGTTGIETPIEIGIKVYPNPTQNRVNLEGLEMETIVSVSNMLGETVLKQQADQSGNCQLDLGQLPKGSYLVNAQSNQGIRVEKVVVE
jgi:hypothetical protein